MTMSILAPISYRQNDCGHVQTGAYIVRGERRYWRLHHMGKMTKLAPISYGAAIERYVLYHILLQTTERRVVVS